MPTPFEEVVVSHEVVIGRGGRANPLGVSKRIYLEVSVPAGSPRKTVAIEFADDRPGEGVGHVDEFNAAGPMINFYAPTNLFPDLYDVIRSEKSLKVSWLLDDPPLPGTAGAMIWWSVDGTNR